MLKIVLVISTELPRQEPNCLEEEDDRFFARVAKGKNRPPWRLFHVEHRPGAGVEKTVEI
jgi:hypothetical protein